MGGVSWYPGWGCAGAWGWGWASPSVTMSRLLFGDFQFPVWDAPVPSALIPTVGALAAAWGALSLVQGHPEPSSGDSWRVLSFSGVREHPGGIPASLTCPKAITPNPTASCMASPTSLPAAPSLGARGGLCPSRAAVLTPSLFPQVPSTTLNVLVTAPAGGCSRPAVLVLQCSRCLASITSPCPELLVLTVSAAGTEPWGHSWGGGTAGLGTSPGCLGCPRGTPVPSPSPQGRCARPPATDLSAGQAGRRMTHGA